MGRRQAIPTALSGWEAAKTVFHAALAAAVVGTIGYVFIVAIPNARVAGAPAPVVADAPLFNTILLRVHIVTALLPLAIGLFTMSPLMRRASIRLHRWLGTTYCAGIFTSALIAFALALANERGLAARAGFATLATAWFAMTFAAYLSARRKDLISHRRWILRSFALTLAVVSIRPMFYFGPQWGLSPDAWYSLLTWICWIPNLVLAEAYIRLTDHAGRLAPLRMKSRSGARAAASSS